MRRVAIFGPPGSGKSTLARKLGAALDVPHFHLDQAFWRAGWIEAPYDTFCAEVARLSALDAWVIDGNYSRTFGVRFARADTAIYLDLPVWITLPRVIWRAATQYGQTRIDMPTGCAERIDPAFLKHALLWRRRNRARMLGFIRDFPGNGLVLSRPREIEAFLARLSSAPPTA